MCVWSVEEWAEKWLRLAAQMVHNTGCRTTLPAKLWRTDWPDNCWTKTAYQRHPAYERRMHYNSVLTTSITVSAKLYMFKRVWWWNWWIVGWPLNDTDTLSIFCCMLNIWRQVTEGLCLPKAVCGPTVLRWVLFSPGPVIYLIGQLFMWKQTFISSVTYFHCTY